MMTRAPRFAKSLAVSLPIPLFAPVIKTVLPSIRTCEISKFINRTFQGFPVLQIAYIGFKLSTRGFQPQSENDYDCDESEDERDVDAHRICVWNLVPSHARRIRLIS
jgi:hypothetical protein